MAQIDRVNTSEFCINAPAFDTETGRAHFTYVLGDLRFEETLAFPAGFDLAAANSPAFAKLLDLAAIVLGVSYFKLAAPFRVCAPDLALTWAEKAFATDVYENGLGEFYARNNLQRFGRLSVIAPDDVGEQPVAPHLPHRALLPIGGGKDSLVSVQLLEAAGLPFTPFAVNAKGPILSSIGRIGIDPVFVERRLDPLMIELGRAPGYFNGHVPATAINSMIAALAALLFGHDTIVMSNERSASEGNVEFDGRIANHQYSKSLDFERRIGEAIAWATGGAIRYFSVLRPYSEARIARMFARSRRFDDVFSSCNRNFRLAGHDGPLWCGECPKCHFVFLIFAPEMDRKRLISIFGHDLLDRPENEASFRELTGLAGQKPWECVGEILEAAASLHVLANRDEWKDDAIVATLRPELLAQYGEERLAAAYRDLFVDSPDHLIPPELQAKVNPDAA